MLMTTTTMMIMMIMMTTMTIMLLLRHHTKPRTSQFIRRDDMHCRQPIPSPIVSKAYFQKNKKAAAVLFAWSA